MTIMREATLEPTPPGAATGYAFSGFPWWLVGIGLTVGGIAWMVVFNDEWREAFDFIKAGLTLTALVTVGGFLTSIVLGLVVALARISKNVVLRNLAMYYIELIRGVPVLVTIMFISIVFFGQIVGSFMPIPSQAVRGTLSLGIIYAAFIAEVFRAGIQSISTGQREAGRSIGLSERQIMRFVVFPQAIRNIMPALGNDLIALLKDSSLVSIIAVRELTQMTRLYTGSSFRFMEGFLILTGFYLVLTVGLSLLLRWYEKRIAIPGY
ncbi:MAG: amino acid ABC transporter permease [Actinobacteria bacterium]|nr:MAG: amino acid ABC transporter permease [Actinomycetota bacterium]